MANSTAQNLKDSIASTQEVKANLGSAVTAAKEGKIQVGAVIRLIALIIAWLNQLAVTFGTYTIPTLGESTVYLIATGITIAITLYSYWKNNSWTANAKTADAVFDLLKNAGISMDDVCNAIGSVVDSRNDKKNE